MAEETADRSDLGKGEYANYFEVGHDFVAFCVDCGQVGYNHERTKIYSRIITSPIGALKLAGVLACALCKYSRCLGPIRDEEGKSVPELKEMVDALCEYVRRFVPDCDEEGMILRQEEHKKDEF